MEFLIRYYIFCFPPPDYSAIEEVVGNSDFITGDNVSSDDGDGGTDVGIEVIPATSPDSGSFTDHYDIVDVREEIRRQPQKTRQTATNMRRRIPSRNRNTLSGAPIFSASPLDPSPISLLGGYMGISVPTTMNDIFEEGPRDNQLEAGLLTIAAGGSQVLGERAPLLGTKSDEDHHLTTTSYS